MTTINEKLREISVVEVAAILLAYFMLVGFINSFINLDFNVGLLEFILLVFFIYKFRDCKTDIMHDFKSIFNKVSLGYILLIVVLNIFFSYGMIYLYYGISAIFPDLPVMLATATSFHSLALLESAFTTVIVAPIVEELLFRGIIFNRLNRRFSFAAAILVSSILFGICHEPGGMFSAFVFGCCMAILYVKSSNILVPILAHFLNNLLSEMIYYFDYGGLIFSDIFVIAFVLIFAAISAYVLFKMIVKEWKSLTG